MEFIYEEETQQMEQHDDVFPGTGTDKDVLSSYEFIEKLIGGFSLYHKLICTLEASTFVEGKWYSADTAAHMHVQTSEVTKWQTNKSVIEDAFSCFTWTKIKPIGASMPALHPTAANEGSCSPVTLSVSSLLHWRSSIRVIDASCNETELGPCQTAWRGLTVCLLWI